MKYVSTRGRAPILDFQDVTLAGLAPDGGLYLPSEWPCFSADQIRACKGLSYAQLAAEIMQPFVGDSLGGAELRGLCAETYGADIFAAGDVTPLVKLDERHGLLELFHGPTLAFKDIALQLLGRLFAIFLARADRRLMIVGATSGDTGSAAIHAVAGLPNVDIVMLHPESRISDVQRRQMTTVSAANVHNVSIRGSFDDAQAMVKRMFVDSRVTDTIDLGAVNSINWARLMAQVVYYFRAALQLGAPDRAAVFSVPTGNFGDVFAGYVAQAMGLPIHRLLVATNENDILHRALAQGDYSKRTVRPTAAPSMDIQVSSNFERLLYCEGGRDGVGLTQQMRSFDDSGRLELAAEQKEGAARLFSSYAITADQMTQAMRTAHTRYGQVVDPHTAIGLAAAFDFAKDGSCDPATPIVTLATAHPAKFPDAVEAAIGRAPDVPDRLADALRGEEFCTSLPADYDTVRDFVLEKAS